VDTEDGTGDPDGGRDDAGTARRDAGLTLLVLVPVAVAAVVLDAPLSPAAVAVGAGGTVLLELLLSVRAARVRAVWADRRVQALAVVVAIAGGVGFAVVVGPWALTALGAGLSAYLAVLAAVELRRRRGPNGHEADG
jgi:hypothetical protein